MKKILHIHNLVFPVLIFFCLVSNVWGGEQDETLLLLEGEGGKSITASRAPKPLSRSAENITIITAADIEALHPHTLTDILATVPGVQVESLRTPGSLTYMRLQGSNFGHVLVLLDGVPLNNLSDNWSDIGLIPARIIERIEIVKGAASSAWGQALGGVINVISKSPESTERPVGGSISATLGEQETRDTGAELTGGIGRFGYYLSGGYLNSDGLLPNNHSRLSNGHAKLTHELPRQGSVTTTFSDFRGSRGDLAYPPWDILEDSTPRVTLASITFRQPIAERFALEVGGRYGEKKYGLDLRAIQDGTQLQGMAFDESTLGFSTGMVWRGTSNLLVAGAEYDGVKLHQTDSIQQVDTLKRDADRWGFYLNDTLSLGAVALSPGIRYDIVGSGVEQFSPSFGITWQISDNNLIRAYTARGYSLPPFLSGLNTEKVWTSQLGIESGSLANLWLKLTLFRNETRDIVVRDSPTTYHLERQIKQGGELELRTSPLYDISLSGGYTYLDARRSGDHALVPDVPSQTLQLGIRYDDSEYLLGVMTGRYLWWNAAANHMGHYSPMVWDLHLTATPFGRGDETPEIFLSVRNLFNGSQYLDDVFRNTGRWAEMGVRYRF